MTTIRVAARKRFTQVSREAVNDTRLSFKARGILVWLLDKPDDWETTAKRIEEQGTEGREAVAGALKELETHGYLTRVTYRDEHNKWRSDWTVSEEPSKPYTGSRQRLAVNGKPYALLKTETDTETRNQKSDDSLARCLPPEQKHSCEECANSWVERRDGSVELCKNA